MSFEDWIFSLHLLIAATLVGGLVMSWIVVVALRSVDDAAETLSLNRVAMVATAAIVVGLVGTIGLGIWLAILRVAVPSVAWLGDRSDRSLGHRDGAVLVHSSSTRSPSRRRGS